MDIDVSIWVNQKKRKAFFSVEDRNLRIVSWNFRVGLEDLEKRRRRQCLENEREPY